ncbi:hypothetical protein HOLleu_23363 [Holothuria leucospilota]|uniref:Uncharacterized protein n=1 Tax=Holothuria leucospilota TaxID=206669 RepID=A0A9Q1BV31_HOLLE|nr:hypothetical protein HOLleu_23363 [Holothuria leucospilota]
MEDNQIFPEVPDELYNAGWRVHYNVEDDKQYFVNEQTKMRSDTLPTVVKIHFETYKIPVWLDEMNAAGVLL